MSNIYITDFDARTDNDNNAEFIQSAIDSLETGGTLIIPAGEYITGALSLKSNITIHLEAGAILKAHSDIRENVIAETHLYCGGWWGKSEPIVVCTYNSTGTIKNVTFDGISAKSENSVIIAGNNISNIKFKDCNFDIDLDKYTADIYEFSPNGLAPKTGSAVPIVNLSDTEPIFE